jgi:inner membrane protein
MSFRRGWTHGVLALAVLPAVFAALMYALDRHGRQQNRTTLKGLLLISYIGMWLHVVMDFLNSYGVRLLMPFSERWFYGDALYIVDPILYVVLGGAILIGRRQAKQSRHPYRTPRRGIAIAAGYVLLMLASNWWARAEVRDGVTRAGLPPDTRFMVTPVFGNPVRRDVVVDMT